MQISIYLVEALSSPCVCTASFSLLSFLPLIYPHAHPLGRCWNSRHYSIFSNIVFSFDLEPAQQLRPNPCLCAFLQNPSTSCLRLLTIYPNVCFQPSHHAIDSDTVFLFDPEPTRQSLPPCVSTASSNFLPSSVVHLPTRPLSRSMLGSKKLFHRFRH
jgi:hypothetical protein